MNNQAPTIEASLNGDAADAGEGTTITDDDAIVDQNSNVADVQDQLPSVDYQSSLFASDTSTNQSSNNEDTITPPLVANDTQQQQQQQEAAESQLFTESALSNGSDRLSKERHSSTGIDDIGATHVDERAPNINLRFYRGLARRRNQTLSETNADDRRRRFQESEGSNSGGDALQNTATSLPAGMFRSIRNLSSRLGSLGSSGTRTQDSHTHTNNNIEESSKGLIQATLVEADEQLEVAVAEKLGFCHLHWKIIVAVTLVIIISIASFTSYSLVNHSNTRGVSSPIATTSPSMSPTFDQRPTLEIITERGHILCGIYEEQYKDNLQLGLCKAIATVTLNNPEKFVLVNITTDNRYIMLASRQVDVLIGGETHTMEREIHEKSSSSGFTFSTPYFYDGMIFAGNPTFLRCAEKQKRYGECANLSICVEPNTRSQEFIASRYSPDFYQTGLLLDMLENKTCNVLAAERLQILKLLHKDNSIRNTEYEIGNITYTNEPLAIVTRNNDMVFSDIVNWVIQGLVFGQRHGVSKDESLCSIDSATATTTPSKMSFLNMLYCVGNYDEVIFTQDDGVLRSEINTINRGTPMLYVTPLGKPEFKSYGISIERIKGRGHINCGAMIRDGYSEDIADVHGLYGMGISYCQSLAAAIFHGNTKALKFITFVDDQSGLTALCNGTIDVLAGIVADFNYDFATLLDQGITFSMPYYLSNETGSDDVSFYSIATPDPHHNTDNTLSSFVNCVILATLYGVQEDISKETYIKMPLFGNDWFLRDVIKQGNYDDLFFSNFMNISGSKRGRNSLNSNGSPQLLELPGLG